jgi:hypothetical protein
MLPKGIRTRSTGDWFSQYMSLGGHAVPINSGLNDFQQISLANNSTDGSALYIWSVSAVTDNSDYFQVATVYGTIGGLARACHRPNPPGLIYYSHDPANPISITPTSFYVEFDPPNSGGNYPLYILPAGFSLVFATSQKCAEIAINFWFMPMLDLKGRQPT